MRTNVIIDDDLLKKAFKYTKISTKRELVDLALREFVDNHQRRDVRELIGTVKIRDTYDYKIMREAK